MGGSHKDFRFRNRKDLKRMGKVNFFRNVNWIDVSTLILIALFSILLFAYFTFLLGFGINFLTVLVVFVSLAFTVKWGKMSRQTVAAFLLLVFGSIGVSLYFFDLSDDGMFYHQDMILAVKEGWNPIWETFDDPFRSSIYVQHYSKGKEILHAFIYFLSGRIESGKALNFLIAAACFIFSYRLLIGYFKKRQSLFFAALITLSPTVVTQLMTTYIDGFAYNLWIIFFVSICFYLKKPNARNAMYVIVSAVIFSTLKFTSLPVLGLTVVFAGIYLLLQKKKLPKNIFKVAAITAVLGLFVNINPYITNLAAGKSIFYPAYGKDMNILDYHLPKEMGIKYEKCDLLDDPEVLYFPPVNKELSTRVKTDLKSEPVGVLGVLRRTLGKFQSEE